MRRGDPSIVSLGGKGGPERAVVFEIREADAGVRPFQRSEVCGWEQVAQRGLRERAGAMQQMS